MPTALYGQVMGWICVLGLVLLLYRSVVGGTLKLYPLFYGYAAQVLITTIVALFIRWPNAGTYRIYYLGVESTFLLMSVGVTWEIYRKVLARFPGVRRLACMLLSMIFGVVVLISARGGYGRTSFVALERDLRTVQGIALLALFALVAYYSIPLGKNIRGIAVGYLFGIATAVLNLSLRYYLGRPFARFWQYSRPLEFLAALAIWCVALWSHSPEPAAPGDDIERDYEWVSGHAVHAMVRLRTHLIHPDGP